MNLFTWRFPFSLFFRNHLHLRFFYKFKEGDLDFNVSLISKSSSHVSISLLGNDALTPSTPSK